MSFYQCAEQCSAKPGCVVYCPGVHPKSYPDACPMIGSDHEVVPFVKMPKTSDFKDGNSNTANAKNNKIKAEIAKVYPTLEGLAVKNDIDQAIINVVVERLKQLSAVD